MKKTLQLLVLAACILFSVGAAINVMSDNLAVEQMASAIACGNQKDCRTTTTRMERTPFSQSFEIVTQKRKVDVKCTRSLVMFGDYACVLR